MPDTPARLGDVIDDYCSRCSLIMNHAVLGLVEDEVKRVRCNTCMHEHAYRRARVPRKQTDSGQDLCDQVRARIPDPSSVPPPQACASSHPPPERPPSAATRARGQTSSTWPGRHEDGPAYA